MDSWGTLESRTKEGGEEEVADYTNTIYNYELGVFFPPTTPSGILANLQLPFHGVCEGRGEEGRDEREEESRGESLRGGKDGMRELKRVEGRKSGERGRYEYWLKRMDV